MVPVPDDQLPVELPYDVEFTGREGNPLSRSKAFVETKCPKCGGPARRETDTMDTFVDSSWYYLRYLSPRDATRMFDPEIANRWMPVDQYIGGIEHAILHLLYARFICKVLHDFGMVGIEEPFQNLFNQGMITRFSEKSGRVEKMSKSRGNTVSPDELIERDGGRHRAGLHALHRSAGEGGRVERRGGLGRLPLPARGSGGMLERLHEAPPTAPADAELERERHATIQRVTQSFERFSFNTAVAALMELSNSLSRALEEKTASRLRCEEAFDTLVQLLHPLAPHITEELLGAPGLHREPARDLLAGVRRGEAPPRRASTWSSRSTASCATGWRWTPPPDEQEVRAAVLASPKVQEHLAGREVAKAVLVPGRLINLVTRKTA